MCNNTSVIKKTMEFSSFKFKWFNSLDQTFYNLNMWNNEWIKGEDYPKWGDTEVYKKTISGGYLLQDETPRDAYMRVAKTVARRLYKPEMAERFFDYIWNGWLCLASPVLSNTGTDRGLPISCFHFSC